MRPLTIFVQSLVTPIWRLDLLVRFFWPLLMWAAVPLLFMVGFIYAHGFSQVWIESVSEPSRFFVMFGLMLVFWLIAVALTVVGLVKWHRNFSLKPDEEVKTQAKGRALLLFVQWFIVGVGLSVWLMLASLPILGLVEAPQLSTPMTDLLIRQAAFSMAVTTFGSIVFSLIFKRRSLMLPFVATDADPTVRPQLIDFPIRHSELGLLLSLSIIVPFAIGIILVFGGQLYSYHGLELGEVFQAQKKDALLPESIGTLLVALFQNFFMSFYPMLVFATFVSLYYREHVRTALLEELTGQTEHRNHAQLIFLLIPLVALIVLATAFFGGPPTETSSYYNGQYQPSPTVGPFIVESN